MAVKDCIWFISGFHKPWEASAAAGLAGALNAARKTEDMAPLRVYVTGGTGNFRTAGACSWKSMTFFERVSTVLFRGKVWHLWGDAPFWWRFIRLRARTVHTSLDEKPSWNGHPTRLFAEQADCGESVIRPTFEVRVSVAGDDKEMREKQGKNKSSAFIIMSEPQDLPEGLNIEAVFPTNSSAASADALFTEDSPSGALLAASLTMQGIPVIAAPLLKGRSYLRALLGNDGYIVLQSRDAEGWQAALSSAAGEPGRFASASARRFLNENYPAAAALESVEALY
ncbi:hypothetical protein FACS1894187_12950 [Synergistales bacterium]|nr:hypothetical protein FACS1894187_12950 [Synergistales bacterium]